MIATARAVLGYDILEAGGFGELLEVLPILRGTLKLQELKQNMKTVFYFVLTVQNYVCRYYEHPQHHNQSSSHEHQQALSDLTL